MEYANVFAELRSELETLRNRLSELENRQFTNGTPIECTKLTIVDSQNRTVAIIDETGFLRCSKLLIEKPGAGSWLAYDPQFGEFTIFGSGYEGSHPVKLVALNENGLGRVSLYPPSHHQSQSFVRVTPDSNGGRMELGDAFGKTICDINTSSAGSTMFLKSKDPQMGSVTLGVDGSGNGKLVTKNAIGLDSGSVP